MQITCDKKFTENYKKLPLQKKDKAKLTTYLALLTTNAALPLEADDHQLRYQTNGIRDFHLRSNIVAVYYLTSEQLTLIDIGSHNYLFSPRTTFVP